LQSRGLEAIAEDFRLVYSDDRRLLEWELSVYDALYGYCKEIIRRENSEKMHEKEAIRERGSSIAEKQWRHRT